MQYKFIKDLPIASLQSYAKYSYLSNIFFFRHMRYMLAGSINQNPMMLMVYRYNHLLMNAIVWYL